MLRLRHEGVELMMDERPAGTWNNARAHLRVWRHNLGIRLQVGIGTAIRWGLWWPIWQAVGLVVAVAVIVRFALQRRAVLDYIDMGEKLRELGQLVDRRVEERLGRVLPGWWSQDYWVVVERDETPARSHFWKLEAVERIEPFEYACWRCSRCKRSMVLQGIEASPPDELCEPVDPADVEKAIGP